MHFLDIIGSLDKPILDVDICIERLVIVDHPSSFEQQPFTLQGRNTKRETGKGGEGWVKFNPGNLIYYTISYVIYDLTLIS